MLQCGATAGGGGGVGSFTGGGEGLFRGGRRSAGIHFTVKDYMLVLLPDLVVIRNMGSWDPEGETVPNRAEGPEGETVPDNIAMDYQFSSLPLCHQRA